MSEEGQRTDSRRVLVNSLGVAAATARNEMHHFSLSSQGLMLLVTLTYGVGLPLREPHRARHTDLMMSTMPSTSR